jgi:Holliday junction DNA helicase RuvA
MVAREANFIVVEAAGVGYFVNVPPSLIGPFGEPGSEVTVYTHLNVREDLFELYGFPRRDQQNLFKLLITVSGVGPKLGMAIVDTLTPDRFALAVLNADLKTLTTVKGLGKKGAERLILEIRDKIKAELPVPPAVLQPEDAAVPMADEGLSSKQNDVLNALLVLGFSVREATGIVAQTYDEEAALEANISAALRSAAKV